MLNACIFLIGAQEKTRTSTGFPPQVPETCASTNSATWAEMAKSVDPLGTLVNSIYTGFALLGFVYVCYHINVLP